MGELVKLPIAGGIASSNYSDSEGHYRTGFVEFS